MTKQLFVHFKRLGIFDIESRESRGCHRVWDAIGECEKNGVDPCDGEGAPRPLCYCPFSTVKVIFYWNIGL